MADDDQPNKRNYIDRNTDPIRFAREVVGGCDPFASSLGISIDDVSDSYARVSLTIPNNCCNAEGRTHGAVLFSLADEAFAVAANSRGVAALALEIKINYFQASGPGDTISAEATPIDIRKRVSLWNVDLTNQNGERIAVAQGMAYHFAQ
jgi:acyl-CoA thioesterase